MINNNNKENEYKCSVNSHEHKVNNLKNDNSCQKPHEKDYGEKCEREHGESCCHETCGCSCGEDSHAEKRIGGLEIFLYSIGALLLVLAFLGEFGYWNKYAAIACSVVVYALFGKVVWENAVRNILKKKIFTEFTLMCVATVGAFALGEFSDAAAVIYLYSLGERISGEAYSRSKRNISRLIEVSEEKVTALRGKTAVSVSASEVSVGEIICVRVGDRVALDGVVVDGNGFADTSAVTGEGMPREMNVGDFCFSGSVLLSGAIYIKVEEKYENSTANKLKRAVERAVAQKALREKRITRFASLFTPAVFAVAVLVLVLGWIFGESFSSALRSSLVVLVASCPCSLVISVPLAYFSGIGAAAKKGIVFRGGQTIDSVATLETLVLDKTGTLTTSMPESVGAIYPEGSPVSKTEMLDLARATLLKSPHLLARVFCEKYKASVNYSAGDVKVIGGRGMLCVIGGKKLALGNKKLMDELGVKADAVDKSAIYVAVNRVLCGILLFDAPLKRGASQEISRLRGNGVKRIAIMSGDNEQTVRRVGNLVGIDELYWELKPDEKLSRLEHIYKEEKNADSRASVGFCGDGLNDSAAVVRADVGIAMGSGSSLTVENADVVIVDDGLARLNDMLTLAQKTVRIVNLNIAISLGAKLAVVAIGLLGFPSLELAVLADVGAAVITVINAARIGK